MEKIIETFELQFDLNPNGAVIRVNNERGCVLRISGIPKKLVFQPSGEVREYIDIAYPNKYSSSKAKAKEEKPIIKIKTIGVIANTTKEFQEWGKANGHNPKMGINAEANYENSPNRYTWRNIRYVCITRIMDVHGYDFDKIISSEQAYLNPHYGEIIEHLNITRAKKIYGNEEHGIVSIMDVDVPNKNLLPISSLPTFEEIKNIKGLDEIQNEEQNLINNALNKD